MSSNLPPAVEIGAKVGNALHRVDRATRSHKARFLAGLTFLIPLGAVIFVVQKVLELGGWTSKFLVEPWLLRQGFGIETLPFFAVMTSLLCLGLLVLLTWFIGSSVSNRIIHPLIVRIEAQARRIPLIGPVYSTVKQVVESLLSQDKRGFKEVVYVPYPNRDCLSLGFVVERFDASVLVYVPTAPNPTSGFVLLVDAEQVRACSSTVGEAVEATIACGLKLADGMRHDLASHRFPDSSGESGSTIEPTQSRQ